MHEDIEILQRETNEIYTILKELETLEDGDNADYSDVVTDITYAKVMLKNRLIDLRIRSQKRC